MEVAGSCERLADDPRTNRGSVSLNELPIGFVFEGKLRNPGDHERINNSQEYRRPYRHEHCCNQVFFHVSPTPIECSR